MKNAQSESFGLNWHRKKSQMHTHKDVRILCFVSFKKMFGKITMKFTCFLICDVSKWCNSNQSNV